VSVVAWIAISAALSLICLRWSYQQISIDNSERTHRLVEAISLVVIGGLSGFIASKQVPLDGALILIIALLLIIQTPIDIRRHQLARKPTIATGIGVFVVYMLRVDTGPEWWESFAPLGVTATLFLMFSFIHGRWPSHLGLGDVFLAVPLALAVGAVEPMFVGWWLLVASLTASIHALMLKSRGTSRLPFGPHLLFAAWGLLMFVL